MRLYYNIIVLILLSLASVTLVSSQGLPKATAINNIGIIVDPLLYSHLKANEAFTFHVHAYNYTTGLNLSNSTTSCYMHLYNSSGNHIVRSKMIWDNIAEWETVILGGNFSYEGHYAIEVWCLQGSSVGGSERVFFDVTGNGSESPSGIVILGFSILLLFILVSSLTIIIKAIGHIINKDFDILDLGYMWGLYFALLGTNRLANIYLGNLEVMNWLNLFITLYSFPMIVVPIIALLLSIFNTKKKKREEANQW